MRNASSLLILVLICLGCKGSSENQRLHLEFHTPPDSARPGVYWYFMDGNLDKQAITADLESMQEAGIGHVVFLEVNVGVPRGKVDFLSPDWQKIFVHAVQEAERLGIRMTMGVGPGWSGSGGPWVRPEQSMQHLVSSSIEVDGPVTVDRALPVPEPRRPYFGERVLTDTLREQWQAFYKDVAVLAFPTPETGARIEDIDEKALVYRAPYSSRPHVKPWLAAPVSPDGDPGPSGIDKENIVDLSASLDGKGRLQWQVPEGKWTIMRFGARNNGAVTRPAPQPGLGFECDKFDTTAFNAHFDEFLGKLLNKAGHSTRHSTSGWTMLHMDSWEMGAQNWTAGFCEEFIRRRGYDPFNWLPVYSGRVVDSRELSERFLWDVRLTAQELVMDYHAGHIKAIARRYGMGLSIEPYDMNPCADLVLGSLADVPMCEFWNEGMGFNTTYSCIEATSIGHVMGRPVVAAEAFTSGWGQEGYISYPANMKNQGDWAFCSGINHFVYHTFAHKPLGEERRPGMTMGGYGVHWDRGQTWWPLVSDYHTYISRCSHLLQQGRTVADILYLTPEGAPHVFRPPASALAGSEILPDRRGYNFDGCAPEMLTELASVEENRIVFPGGASYRLLVLPSTPTMTPELINKIRDLVRAGAIVVGQPPRQSPSLVNYPQCDADVQSAVETLWGSEPSSDLLVNRHYGKGTVYHGKVLAPEDSLGLYPHYDVTAAILQQLDCERDFESDVPLRYTHRRDTDLELYFVSNPSNRPVQAECIFRANGQPELWDPVTGEIRPLAQFRSQGNRTSIPLTFYGHQSYFVVFTKNAEPAEPIQADKNFPDTTLVTTLQGSWEVSFDPQWGGPERITFKRLQDWSTHPEQGIKYYSGIATYEKSFEFSADRNTRFYLQLGTIKGLAEVTCNGKNLGGVWTAPWCIEITGAVKSGTNQLEIKVANLWANRLIGDEQYPDDGIEKGQWPEWILENESRPTDRYAFSTFDFYEADDPLQESGLMGPVNVVAVAE
ncbi:glycosyl hydrolase [candidate division KSB1 bacterium]|nr:glycosyl hydrolase [candidate division KSB1 bacterium]